MEGGFVLEGGQEETFVCIAFLSTLNVQPCKR